MTAIENTPSNKNFLSPLGFRFMVKKLPHVNFFAQKANIPGISIASNPEQPNPFVVIPYAGDHLQYNELTVAFRVDEDLQNYLEIHNWLVALGFPEKYEQYRALATKPVSTGDGLKSDASLIITSNGMNPKFDVTFQDAFPVSLSDLNFDSTDESVQYLEATVEFRYTLYKINPL